MRELALLVLLLLGTLLVDPLLSSTTDDGSSSIQRIRSRRPSSAQYVKPRMYPCMDDWHKTCAKDSDCCSGQCLKTFCKIVGVEKPSTVVPRRRAKRPQKPNPHTPEDPLQVPRGAFVIFDRNDLKKIKRNISK